MSTRAIATALFTALLAACAGAPPPPAWQAQAQAALQAFSSAYLDGNARVAELEFARARHALAATGRASLVAQAELVRCATRVASLDFEPCTAFEALRQDATAAELAYADYIAGRWDSVDAAVLPVHHRAVIATGAHSGRSPLAAIDDPLARLVAAGALMQAGRLSPADIEVATETASEQGWRRPLLAWLGVQAQRAERAGEHEARRRIQRRIELVGGSR